MTVGVIGEDTVERIFIVIGVLTDGVVTEKPLYTMILTVRNSFDQNVIIYQLKEYERKK